MKHQTKLPIKAVFFDFDDTLQSRKGAYRLYCEAFLDKYFPGISAAERTQKLDEMEAHVDGGYKDREVYFPELIALWQWHDHPPLQELYDSFNLDFGKYIVLLPGAVETLNALLHDYAPSNQLVFLKDTCCDYELIHERIDATRGTPLKIYNANCQSWYDTFCYGAAGYSGVMANFHPDLYKYCVTHKDSNPEKAKLVADFLCAFGMIERTCYPVSCKYYHQIHGVKMSTYCRSADRTTLLNAGKEEVWSLINLEDHVRELIKE